jgi:hypothetical protein
MVEIKMDMAAEDMSTVEKELKAEKRNNLKALKVSNDISPDVCCSWDRPIFTTISIGRHVAAMGCLVMCYARHCLRMTGEKQRDRRPKETSTGSGDST